MNDVIKTLNKALFVWKKECEKHDSCDGCPFFECIFGTPPDCWKDGDVKRSIGVIYDLGWKGGADE